MDEPNVQWWDFKLDGQTTTPFRVPERPVDTSHWMIGRTRITADTFVLSTFVGFAQPGDAAEPPLLFRTVQMGVGASLNKNDNVPLYAGRFDECVGTHSRICNEAYASARSKEAFEIARSGKGFWTSNGEPWIKDAGDGSFDFATYNGLRAREKKA